MSTNQLIGKVADAVTESGAWRGTLYLDAKQIVRVSRRYIKRAKGGRGAFDETTFVVSIGRPNYRERLFIKQAKAAGESFPIKKVQLRFRKR